VVRLALDASLTTKWRNDWWVMLLFKIRWTMKTRWMMAALVVSAMFGAATSHAQDTRGQREELERLFDTAPSQRGISKPSDEPFSERGQAFKPAPLGEKRDFLWDVGGWGRATYSTFDTQFGRDSTIRDIDIRVWGDVSLYKHHRAYGRLRTFHASGDSDNWQSLRVDQLFYEGQVARMLGWSETADLDVTVGRQFFFMGKGLALANVLEGVRVYGRSTDWEFEGVAAQTIKYSADFDSSLPLTKNQSKRMFLGGTVSKWVWEGRNKFYGYALAQIDNNDLTGTLANPAANQAYTYDSTYFGLGSEGALPIPGARANELGYSVEAVMQTGSSIANNTSTEESIRAFAFLADIFWLPGEKLPFPSRMIFGYGFGTGDPDRQNQNGTLAGNTAGTDDTAFNYFGYANTGYALGPKLTNLHFFKVNFEGTFLQNAGTWTKELKVGATVYSFFKHHSNEVISDFTAIRPNGWLGTELDLYADWAVSSDLDIGMRYGAFLPGDSYTISKARQYLSLFLQLSF